MHNGESMVQRVSTLALLVNLSLGFVYCMHNQGVWPKYDRHIYITVGTGGNLGCTNNQKELLFSVGQIQYIESFYSLGNLILKIASNFVHIN